MILIMQHFHSSNSDNLNIMGKNTQDAHHVWTNKTTVVDSITK